MKNVYLEPFLIKSFKNPSLAQIVPQSPLHSGLEPDLPEGSQRPQERPLGRDAREALYLGTESNYDYYMLMYFEEILNKN